MNWELPDIQTGFRKGRGARDQIANICLIIEKAKDFQKNIYFCLKDYTKSFECVDHNKLWKILEVMGPDATVLVFWMLSFKATFSLFSSIFILSRE